MSNKTEIYTLGQFLQNPTGHSSAYMASRERIRIDLEARYEKLTHRNKITHEIYKNGLNYLFVFKVPSEKYKGLFYDVCIEFKGKESIDKDDTLNRYEIRLFSNSPNFVFTYAYVLNKKGMLSPTFADKLEDIVLTQRPQVRNPVGSLGFEKSCYFAALYMREKKLTNKSQMKGVKTLNKKTLKSLLDEVKTDTAKLFEYNKFKQKEKNSIKNRLKKAITQNAPIGRHSTKRSTKPKSKPRASTRTKKK